VKKARHFVAAGEAARRLGVTPVTIQRWADQGVIAAERTAGGHRRIPVAEVSRLLTSSRAAKSGEVADWVATLMTADADRIHAALAEARMRAQNWATIADEVAAAVNEIGRSWEDGDCAGFEEQMASEALRRAAIRCVAGVPRPPAAPAALLLTVENDRHTLGLSLAELVFAERGWRTLWVGEGPPRSELEAMVDALKPDLVAASASLFFATPELRPYQRTLVRLAITRGFPLLLGGAAPWAESGEGHRLPSFCKLDLWLESAR